ncbi:hypothetical protein METHPM2_720023 [Pseudomonas sp. PM2]
MDINRYSRDKHCYMDEWAVLTKAKLNHWVTAVWDDGTQCIFLL